jgi:hypothetical protein
LHKEQEVATLPQATLTQAPLPLDEVVTVEHLVPQLAVLVDLQLAELAELAALVLADLAELADLAATQHLQAATVQVETLAEAEIQ